PLLALLFVLSLAAPLAAQPVPAGPEFPLDDVQLSSAFLPATAVAPNGSFLGVWDSLEGAIRARAFSPSGAPLAPASELRPAEGPSYGLAPLAVALAGGGYVAVWLNETPTVVDPIARVGITLDHSLSYRRLNALGQPAGPEIRVAEHLTGSAVAADPSGGFLLVWGEAGEGVFAQRFDAQGQPAGAELTLATPFPPYDAAVLP